jgi:glucose-6-phosphate 1-dehydrogenase (EC 1.1.1.49)
LVFRIQPDEGISLQFAAKRPVMQVQVENVRMDFSYSSTWRKQLPEAYERLLLDVLRGDSTLFTRSDEVEAAWRVVDPILTAWREQPDFPLAHYAPGSWGPAEADTLFTGPDQAWRIPA